MAALDERLLDVKYHLKCYRLYTRKGDRATENVEEEDGDVEFPDNTTESSATTGKRSKRDRKSDVDKNYTKCIICNKAKNKNETVTFRICEVPRAKLFLEARKSNLDDVYTRTSTLESVEDVFAADIRCHKTYK